MKKTIIILLIYISGYAVAWYIAFTTIKGYKSKLKYNHDITVGDLMFVSGISLLSWAAAVSAGIVYLITVADFTDRVAIENPYKPKQ